MIYDFICEHCENEEKDWHSSVDERDNQKCPKCGQPMKRLVNAGQNVIFGDSFYNSGEIRRASCIVTSKDGSKRTIDLRNKM